MIVVTVHLASAVDGRCQQLARMHISNDGQATLQNPRLGDYVGETFVGRDAEALAQGRVAKRGAVRGWRRHDFHVWNLVRRMLEAMGYDKGGSGGSSRTAFADLGLVDPDGPDVVSLAHLDPDQRADVVAHLAGLDDPEEEYGTAPEGGWNCFHCGRHFTTIRGARLHFGPTPDSLARCLTAEAFSGTAVDHCIRVDTRILAVMADEIEAGMAGGLDIHQAFTGVSGGVMGALLALTWRNRTPGVSIDQLADHLRQGMHGILTVIAAEEAGVDPDA